MRYASALLVFLIFAILALPIQAANHMVLNVRDFGAVGDGTTDDTAAIQATINAAKLNPGGASGGTTVLYFPPGRYTVSSLNVTRTDNLGMVGVAGSTVIYADKQTGSSRPVFDLTGSNNVYVYGLSVNATDAGGMPPNIKPTVAFLIAQTSTKGDSNANYFEFVGGQGYFLHAFFYFYNSVDNTCMFCKPQNNELGRPSFIITNVNSEGLSSPYQTIDPSPDVSANISFFNIGSGCVVIRGSSNVNFYGGTIAGCNTVAVGISNEANNIGFYNTQFAPGTGIATAVVDVAGGNYRGLTFMSNWLNNVTTDTIPFIHAAAGTALQNLVILGLSGENIHPDAEVITHELASPVTGKGLNGGLVDAAGHNISAGSSVASTVLLNVNTYTVPSGATDTGVLLSSQGIRPPTVLAESLGTPINGTLVYCANCTRTSLCAGGGTGAFAHRLAGVWSCN